MNSLENAINELCENIKQIEYAHATPSLTQPFEVDLEVKFKGSQEEIKHYSIDIQDLVKNIQNVLAEELAKTMMIKGGPLV